MVKHDSMSSNPYVSDDGLLRLEAAQQWYEQQIAALERSQEVASHTPNDLPRLQKQSIPWETDKAALRDLWLWRIQSVGDSSACWMERSILFTSLLLDKRTPRFRRLAIKPPLAISEEVARLEHRHKQAVSALVFAWEWQRYLRHLLMVIPRDPAEYPETPDPIWQYKDRIGRWYDFGAVEHLARLATCRPAGAFFEPDEDPPFGRDTCGLTNNCPYCHTRRSVRVVQRVEEGPWRKSRRPGRHLFMARVTVPTDALALDSGRVASEQKQLYEAWLPFCDEWAGDYVEPTPERDFASRIESQQYSKYTMTPYELEQAKVAAEHLKAWCQSLGVSGGLKIHQVGPQRRNFAHEIVIVGEVRLRGDRDHRQFCKLTGIGHENEFKEPISGQKVECILMPRNASDAARILLAGTAWKYDLKSHGAMVNRQAARKIRYGWRGALAWPPLFLLSGVSFWSRHRTLFCRTSRHQHSSAFGSWRDELPSDRDFRSPSQRHRQRELLSLKEGRSGDVLIRLDRLRRTLEMSKADLARKADVSRSLISAVFNRTRKPKPELLTKLKEILRGPRQDESET